MAHREQRPATVVAGLPTRARARLDANRLLPSGRSVLLGLSLFAGCVAAYFGARESSVFAITTIEVRGASPRVAGEVRDALRSELGVSLLKVDLDAVVRDAESVPDVRAATLDRAFPHTLVVTIRAERPVAVLRRGADSWLVSARGRVLRSIPRGSARWLPRIWVAKKANVRLGQVLAIDDGARAAAALAPVAGTQLAARILYVRASEEEVTLVLRSGLELRLGDAGDLRLKLAVARPILALIGSEAGSGTYLDVSVLERPVARLSPQVEG